ncbi:MAG: bifunctional adenosylcobinamide kinase/adenosylcobinamide-phosphate guanylyltransferase [Acidimicrobiia bacterium]
MIVLFLGGSRSGKSQLAEDLASFLAGANGSVSYFATMYDSSDDRDLDERIEIHRHRRPSHWQTVEPPYDLAQKLIETTGVVLLDSLATWFSALEPTTENTTAAGDAQADLERTNYTELVQALRNRQGHTVIVSDEVGMGVHPATSSGRAFRDGLGLLNQTVANTADHVYLAIAGRVMPLTPFHPETLLG